MRRFFALLAAVLLFAASPSLASDRLMIYVTQPWLAITASFIGGPNTEIVQLNVWRDDGTLAKADKGRMRRAMTIDSLIIALDRVDAAESGIDSAMFPNLSVLYDPFPVSGGSMDAAMSDPSVLPFVAQRILAVLSGWDPSNYSYYQRRLAEFQARLSSSVLAGRQVLQGIAVLDLSGSSSALLQALGCVVKRPENIQELEESARWGSARVLDMLEEQADDGMIIFTDSTSPKNLLRVIASAVPGGDRAGASGNIRGGRLSVFHLGRPPSPQPPKTAQDYPSFLHDQFISMWQRITARPLPPRRRQGG